MTRAERWCLHLCVLGMALTGLAYGWLKYFHQRLGEFGTEPYPAQGWFRHGHIVLGPMLVFTLGLVVRGHVLPALRSPSPRGRLTGLLLAAILAPMVLSGYGVQVFVDPAWRTAMAWVHGISSVVFLLGFGAHLVRRKGS